MKALTERASYKSPRIEGHRQRTRRESPAESAHDGEVICIVGYGRVAAQDPETNPDRSRPHAGLGRIHPTNRAAADRARGPGPRDLDQLPDARARSGELRDPDLHRRRQGGSARGGGERVLGGDRRVEARSRGRSSSARSRGSSRASPSERESRQAGGKKSPVGLLASLGAQATLTALDTPDTRSWETLPARVAVGRVRVSAGKHTVVASARGVTRTQAVEVGENGWSVVSLQALR